MAVPTQATPEIIELLEQNKTLSLRCCLLAARLAEERAARLKAEADLEEAKQTAKGRAE